MHIQSWPLDRLSPCDANPRHIPEDAIAGVASSIRSFGFRQPIVVDADGVIIVGHTRYLAAKQLKLDEVPVHVADGLSPEQVAAYRLADNKTGEASSWDEQALAEILGDLTVDLRSVTGFKPDELDALLADVDCTVDMVDQDQPGVAAISSQAMDADAHCGEGLANEPVSPVALQPEENASPQVANTDEVEVSAARESKFLQPKAVDLGKPAITQPGDIWELGDHRIMCGDCRDEKLLARLFAGREWPKLLVSDPPYCSGGFQEAQRGAGTWGAITNDNLSTRGYQALIKDVLLTLKPDAVYLFTDWRMWITLFDLVEASGLCVRSMIVWDKGNPGLGALWRTQHELICFGTNQSTQRRKGVPAHGNVLQAKRTGNIHHYTEKPVDLMEQILTGDRCSDRGDGPVFDPFMGSGTTLLAAERQGRICYGSDLVPQFVDVAVKRWEEATGQQAKRLPTESLAREGVG